MQETHQRLVPLRWAIGVPIVAALLLALLLASGANREVFFLINRFPWPADARLWSNVTIFGDTMPLLCLLLPFVGRRSDLVWAIAVALLVVACGVDVVKELLHMPRPPALLRPDQFHLIGYRAETDSFPSGHSAAAFAFAGAICMLRFPLPAKIAVLCGAVLVAVSRVAVGAHWPQDVLGGAVFGWLGMWASIWLAARWPRGRNPGPQRGFALLLVFAALYTAWTYTAGYPLARPLLIVMPLVMLALAWPGLRRLFGTAAP